MDAAASNTGRLRRVGRAVRRALWTFIVWLPTLLLILTTTGWIRGQFLRTVVDIFHIDPSILLPPPPSSQSPSRYAVPVYSRVISGDIPPHSISVIGIGMDKYSFTIGDFSVFGHLMLDRPLSAAYGPWHLSYQTWRVDSQDQRPSTSSWSQRWLGVEVAIDLPYYWRFQIDWLTLFIFLSLLVSTQFVIAHRRKRPRNPQACRTCGYDLRASPDRCPECGTIRIEN